MMTTWKRLLSFAPVALCLLTGGTARAQVNVEIVYFEASPEQINAGESATLRWETRNATTATIDNGIGEVAVGQGSVVVSPAVTTTYTLTATCPSGTVTAQATLTVTATQKPVVIYFRANPSQIALGKKTTLSWKIDYADSAEIDNGVGAVNAQNGTVEVRPDRTTTYTLTARNTVGAATANVGVTVITTPIINWFVCSNGENNPIHSSENAYLGWSVVGADIIAIDNGVGTVDSADGRIAVSPDRTTTYILEASNSAGTVIAEATVGVTDKPIIRAFYAVPASVAKGQAVNFYWKVVGAVRVNVTPFIGFLPGHSGSIGHIPEKTTTYKLDTTNVNNWVQKSFLVTVVANTPELQIGIDRVSVSGRSAFPPIDEPTLGKGDVGQPATIEAVVTNAGSGAAERFRVRLKEDGYVIDEGWINGLGAGDSASVELDYTPTTVGDHSLELIADPDNLIPELDKVDNTLTGTFRAGRIEGIDLVVSRLKVEPAFDGAPEGLMKISFRITNCGTENAGRFQYKIYVTAKEKEVTLRDTLAMDSAVERLGGKGDYIDISGVINVRKLKMKFYIQALLDYTAAVIEVNEANNVVKKKFIRKYVWPK